MNRLAEATSPYLRQHADNPVDWFPWGEEARAEARRRDVPLLISIGYAACHWCHVMAHESFADAETAAQINAGFVPVKIDREERPDLDAIYLEAVQALTGRGGWPLTVFATPDGRPFFGGTYFPRTPLPGVAAFPVVLEAVGRAWAERRDELDAQASELTAAVGDRLAPPRSEQAGAPAAAALLAAAARRAVAIADPTNGGLGQAPKFPQPPTLELVLRAARGGDAGAAGMLRTTLGAMAAGGIYDHLEGGFCRYSVDAAWQVPHFEKMLYDQALLARLYLHAYQWSGDARWRQVARETLEYVLTILPAPDGGFCASEDADSEGEEGRFSTWTPAELAAALGPERAEAAAAAYGVSAAGNFEGGRSVLHRPPGEILRDDALEELRRDLAARRARRVRPARDDKVLTEWNAMAVVALAEAGLALGEARYVAAAEETATFLCTHLRDEAGRWQRSYRAGRTSGLAVAADYAWLVEAFTRLGEATGAARWTDEARRTAVALQALFAAADGGWYTTGSDGEELVVRPRESYDGVLPSAASVAAVALARLGSLLEDHELLATARRTITASSAALTRAPLAVAHLLWAAELLEEGPVEVVVTGERPDLVAAVARTYLPYAVLAWGEPTGPLFQGRSGERAWVCRKGTCLPPIADAPSLIGALGAASPVA